MALQSQQLIAIVLQIAKAYGYTAQAGQLLNMILSELSENYDLEVARRKAIVNVNSSLRSGPYLLPADYQRMANNEVFYYVNQVPYVMVNIELWEFDSLVQQDGISTYPSQFATDTSGGIGNCLMYVWPPPGGSYDTTIRYYSRPDDISTPETSTVIPWFPNQSYLIARLAGEIMGITGDARRDTFLGDSDGGARGILRRFLELQKDDEGRAQKVQLDRRLFGARFDRLPNTKNLGW